MAKTAPAGIYWIFIPTLCYFNYSWKNMMVRLYLKYIIAFPQESTKTGQTKLVTRQRSFLCTHRQFIIYIKLNPFSDWVWYITPTLSKLHAFSGRNSKQSNLINGTSVHKQFKTLRHYGCNKPPTNINCSYSCQWISPSAS